MNNFKQYMKECDKLYFSNDIPCPYVLRYNKMTINTYPIKVKDWAVFEDSYNLIIYNKNEIDDIRIIQMSYLEFLYQIIIVADVFGNGEAASMALGNFFKYVLHEDDARILFKNNEYKIGIFENDKLKYDITSKEFEQLKDMAMYQNIFEYDDREISADVRDLYLTYVKATQRNNIRIPSLEEQKTYVMSQSGFSMQEINNMSYRVFNQLFNHDVDVINFIADKMIQASSKYQVDEEIIHPCYEKKKDKYAALFTDASTLAQKGINGVSQLNGLVQ